MIFQKVAFRNENYDNRVLKDYKSSFCRVFSITGNGQEFMPNSNTKLLIGNLIILVVNKDKVYETHKLLSGEI